MNKLSRKFLTWVIPALCLVLVGVAVIRAFKSEKGFHYKEFAALPVVSNGRVQPLDSLARNALLSIVGKQRVPGTDVPKSPAEWFAELSFRPEIADERKIFLIHHDEILGLTGLTRSEEKTYSYSQILPSFAALQPEARRISAKDAQTRSPYEKALMRLTHNLGIYNQLKHTLAHPGQTEAEEEIKSFLANPASSTGLQNWASFTGIYALPSNTGDAEWKKLPESLIDSIQSGELHPASIAYARIGDAYRSTDPAAFNKALSDYKSWLAENRSEQLVKGHSEAIFNRVAPFILCMVLYVVAFLCAILSWLWKGSVFRQAAFRTLLIGFALHTAGLIIRMLLEGRPPVTNLYSSAVFIGWGAIALSIAIELFYRNAIGTAVAGMVGFATLLIAHHLSLSGDTLEMMRAVLDTNFWLATHVVVITLGYSATFLAGSIAIFYLFFRLFAPVPKDLSNALRGMVYGVLCFATLASFVGTVLGGIWADQSWGRFWGWDPKENGALLIVIWNAIILHARWGGMVKERGMMVMAVFGNIVTSWSWFGTNMLGIGLHSYGFTDAAFAWLSGFIISQIVIMALGYIPRKQPTPIS